MASEAEHRQYARIESSLACSVATASKAFEAVVVTHAHPDHYRQEQVGVLTHCDHGREVLAVVDQERQRRVHPCPPGEHDHHAGRERRDGTQRIAHHVQQRRAHIEIGRAAGERTSPREWLALVVGLAGVVVLCRGDGALRADPRAAVFLPPVRAARNTSAAESRSS